MEGDFPPMAVQPLPPAVPCVKDQEKRASADPVEDPGLVGESIKGAVDFTVNKDEEQALFVCYFCDLLSAGGKPVLRIFNPSSVFLREIRLVKDGGIYSCLVPVHRDRTLHVRVAVKLFDSYTYEETVFQGSGYFRNTKLCRIYQYSPSKFGSVFTAVVRDKFETRWSAGPNTSCYEPSVARGWLHLLQWLSTHFASEPSVDKFIEAFDHVQHCQCDKMGGISYLRDKEYMSCLLSSTALRARSGELDPSEVLKWMFLADRVQAYSRIQLMLDRPTFVELGQLSLFDVYHSVMAVHSSAFLKVATSFITSIMEGNDKELRVPWAMLRLAFSPPNPQAEKIVRAHPAEAAPYLPLFLQPTISPTVANTVFSLFPSFRIFQDLQQSDPSFVLPASVILSISTSSYYQMPVQPDLALSEYQALMHFMLSKEELLYSHFADHKHLRVNSPALKSLGIHQRAEVAVLPLLRMLASGSPPGLQPQQAAPLVIQRCRELREFLQTTSTASTIDDSYVQNVYAVVRTLFDFEHVPGVLVAIRDFMAALPSSNSKGLMCRFVAFLLLPANSGGLIALEAEAFQKLCVKRENDPVAMRKAFRNAMSKVLKVDDQGEPFPYDALLHLYSNGNLLMYVFI